MQNKLIPTTKANEITAQTDVISADCATVRDSLQFELSCLHIHTYWYGRI